MATAAKTPSFSDFLEETEEEKLGFSDMLEDTEEVTEAPAVEEETDTPRWDALEEERKAAEATLQETPKRTAPIAEIEQLKENKAKAKEDLKRIRREQGQTRKPRSELGDAMAAEYARPKEEQKTVRATPSNLDPTSGGMKTSYESLYRSDPALADKEDNALNTFVDEFATQEELDQAQKDIEEVRAAQWATYDSIEGDNVESDLFGKRVVNPDGSSNYVPSPLTNDAAILVLKTVTDTASGIADAPTLIGLPGGGKYIPKVSTENPATEVVSELAQLTFGATAALKLGKLDKVPESIDKIRKAIPMLEGTLRVGAGTAIVADEDYVPMLPSLPYVDEVLDPAESIAGKKWQAFMDNALIGVVLGSLSKARTAIDKLPSGGIIAGTLKSIALLRVGSEKLEKNVIESLAEELAQSQRFMNAGTIEEVDQGVAMYTKAMDEISMAVNGVPYEQYIREGTEAATDIPLTIGELMSDEGLTKLYAMFRKGGGSDDGARAIMAQMIGKNETKRIQAIAERAEALRLSMAPTGRQAAVEVREGIDPEAALAQQEAQIAEAQAGVEQAREDISGMVTAGAREDRGQAIVQRDTAISTAEQETEAALAAERGAVEQAREEATTAEQALGERLSASEMAPREGAPFPVTPPEEAAKPLRTLLDEDVALKNALYEDSREALATVEVPVEELADISTTAKDMVLARVRKIESDPALQADYSPEDLNKLKSVMVQIDQATDPEVIFKLSARATKLIEGMADDAVETVTLADIEAVRAGYATVYNDGRQAATQRARVNAQAAKEQMDSLDTVINRTLETAPEAKQAYEGAKAFYRDTFSERWAFSDNRMMDTFYGNASTPDAIQASVALFKRISNPQQTQAGDLAQFENILAGLAPEARAGFEASVADHAALDFISRVRNKVGNMEVTGSSPIKTATAIEAELKRYLADTEGYFKLFPQAKDRILALQQSIASDVANARQAAESLAVAESQAKANIAEINSKLKTAKGAARRELELSMEQVNANLETQKARLQKVYDSNMAKVNRVAEDIRNSDATAALQSLGGFKTNPSAYFDEVLNNQKTGLQQVEALWEKAGTDPRVLESGITQTQQYLKEAVLDSLLRKSNITATSEAGVPKVVSIVEAFEDKGTAMNQIVEKIFADSPEGKELFSDMMVIMQRFNAQQKGTTIRVADPAADVQNLQSAVMDLNRVFYGPLTKEARISNMITRWSIGAMNLDSRTAEMYVKVMTEPKYAKMVLDRAAEIRKMALVPEEEAYGRAFLSAAMKMQGANQISEVVESYGYGDDSPLWSMDIDPIWRYKASERSETERAFSK